MSSFPRLTAIIALALATTHAPAQMMAEMHSQSAPVRSFVDETTSSIRRGGNTNAKLSTATLKGSDLLEKVPVRLPSNSKKTPGYGQAEKGPNLETRVIPTGIDAKDFLQVIAPTLGKNLTAKQIDGGTIAVTGTSESLRRVGQVSEQVRSAMKRTAKRVQLHVALLGDHQPEESSASLASDSKDLSTLLPSMGLTPADMDGSALPPKLWRIADMTAPATGGGENRVLLTQRLTLLYELRETLSGDYEMAVNLAEKDKNANPFDTSVGRVIFANQFRTGTQHPVILGITTPARTLMLVLRLSTP